MRIRTPAMMDKAIFFDDIVKSLMKGGTQAWIAFGFEVKPAISLFLIREVTFPVVDFAKGGLSSKFSSNVKHIKESYYLGFGNLLQEHFVGLEVLVGIIF